MKISKETVRAAMDETLGEVSLSEWDRQRIVHTARSAARRRYPAGSGMRRLCALGVTFALCMALSLGVLAAVPGLAEKLSMLSRQTLAYLTPVNEQCTSSDIRMEVVAAMNDGNTAVVYVSLQDLSGENRLDDTTWTEDLMLEGLDCTMCDNVYRKEDGTVILRITGQNDRTSLAGQKVRLHIRDLLAENSYDYMADTGYTVADVMAVNAEPRLAGCFPSNTDYTVNGTLNGPLISRLESGSMQMLKAETDLTLNAETQWLHILNAGVVDGALHILTDPEDACYYNTLEFVLADAEGSRYNEETGLVDRGAKVNPGTWRERTEQQEQILMLPRDVDYADMHIYYNYSQYNTCIEGDWDATFTLQQETPEITIDCDMDMKPWRLTELSVSPIGVTLRGEGELWENSCMPDVTITLADGTVKAYSSAMTTILCGTEEGEDGPAEPDQILSKCLFDEPADMDQIVRISLDGRLLWQRT